MTTLLSLQPPVPTQTMTFDRYFRGDDVELATLSRQRRVMRTALEQRPLDVVAASVAVNEYRDAWLAFWRRRIVNRNSSARTHHPLSFEWRVQLVSARSHSIVYTDPSPLVETACVQLASAALHQRLAAESSTPSEVERHAALALTQLENLRVQTLEPLARRYVEQPPARSESKRLAVAMDAEVTQRRARRREPEVLSPLLVSALERSVRAVLNAKRAVVAASQQRLLDASGHFFVASRLFSSAAATLPAERQLAESACRVNALAYRYLAETIVSELPDEAGVGVALAREAAAQDTSSVSMRRFCDDMDNRNRIVFGMRTVPDGNAIILDLQRRSPGTVVRVEHAVDGQHVTVVVPLPMNIQ